VNGQSSTGTVIVENKGADASGVTAVVVSDAISASSSPVDVRHGSSSSIPITITAKDVPDGAYAVVVYLQYSNGTSTSKTDSKGTSIYLLPKLTLTTPRFEADLFHPFGKNSIGTNDGTTVLFQVQSTSSSVIYSGMCASATLDLNVPGLSIVPTSSAIGPIGPNGRPPFQDHFQRCSTRNIQPANLVLLGRQPIGHARDAASNSYRIARDHKLFGLNRDLRMISSPDHVARVSDFSRPEEES